MAIETNFSTSWGEYQLLRSADNAEQKGQFQTLRAWDAADEYALHWLAEQNLSDDSKVLVLNDGFGALSTALHRYCPQSLSDSYVAQQACRDNLLLNKLPQNAVTFTSSMQWPTQTYDLVLIKIPKTLALLEDQLFHLRQCLDSRSIVVAAAMTKNIHNSTTKLFSDILGETTTSLARKKARLIFCQFDATKPKAESPYPTSYKLDGTDYQLINDANVFSRSGLDVGTRLLIRHIPESDQALDIVDMACGNGVVGLLAARSNPQAKLHFYDESYMAVASAEANFTSIFAQRQAVFHVDDCLSSMPKNSADLMLSNPPFHQQTVVGDFIAWQMFNDAKRVLRKGGELRIVANRHMAYHTKLKRLFGNCTLVASNKKFVVLKTIKTA